MTTKHRLRGDRFRVFLRIRLPLLAYALRCLIEAESDLAVVNGPDEDGHSLSRLRRHRFDAIVMDSPVGTEDTLRAIEQIVAASRSGLLVIAIDFSEEMAMRMFRAGARGVLPLSAASAGDVLVALRAVARQDIYLPPSLQRRYAERFLGVGERSPLETLSDRELEVMRLLALGDSNAEVGAKLHISVKTVDTHRANVLRKLALRNNAELTRFALRHRLISP